ncbi:biproductal, ADP-L-glycero-D-manno-heptose synthase, N-terminal putative kinase and C-terminal putative sugar nucleotide transferase [Serratia symbiotica str. 'Cinara cedri']|nr:biproductal, ADP-L-glycero-D-manno-heptose synthase, N-terminal putative kinase and C-terminal putative sugar nucleotide transferase [Serratia symbiotica str. 'Cinara cedri']
MKIKPPDFRNTNILVVGDIMLDRYWHGQTHHISLEAPVPVVKVNHIEERPGGAANVAMNIASLGSNTHLIGLTGIDDAAHTLHDKLNQVNVRCDLISIPTHPTITKLRVLSRNQQLIRLDFEDSFYNVDTQPILGLIQKALPHIDVLVLSDYAKGTLNQVQNIIKLARAAKVMILIDPKGSDFKRYSGATLLTPNLSEFEAIVGHCKNENNLVERGMKLITDFSLSALLITRSEYGMTLLQPGVVPLHLPAQAQEVFDVTGAGDTVIGVLAASLAAKNSLEESCFLANAAAGTVVGKIGTSSVSLVELENTINFCVDNKCNVMTIAQLKTAVTQARMRGEKVVMTNGIFDILHAGHISYLSNARKLGDRLIVAVNSDASTKRLKGKARPINTLKNRMIVLSALKSVDWIVSFEEDTPRRLINDILPDLLVKGGDYKPEDIAGSSEVWANNGDVKVLAFEKGLSTTNIINSIKNY